MILRSLLFCPDPKTAGVLVRVLADLEISVETFNHAQDAVEKLRVERYDAIILDCDDKANADLLLNNARESPFNQNSLVAAIIDPKASAKNAFGVGASLVLYKPMSMERAKSSLRAARGLMKRERRSILRIPVQGLSSINSDHETSTQAIMVDLNEGGMAIRCAEALNAKEALSIRFTLPDSSEQITVTGEVAWQDRNGRFGIRFLDTSQASRRALKEWFSANAHKGEATPQFRGRVALPQG